MRKKRPEPVGEDAQYCVFCATVMPFERIEAADHLVDEPDEWICVKCGPRCSSILPCRSSTAPPDLQRRAEGADHGLRVAGSSAFATNWATVGSKARPTWPTGSSGQVSWTYLFVTPGSRMNDVSCGVTRASKRDAITVYFTPGCAIGRRSTAHGGSADDQLVAGRAAELPQDLVDQRAEAEVVAHADQAAERRTVRRRRERDHLAHLTGVPADLGPVDALEAALGVPDDVDLGRTGRLADLLDEGLDLRRRLRDRDRAADRDRRAGLAVGEGEGAVALRGEERAEVRVVAGAVAAQPVQQDKRVRMRGRRLAGPVVEPEDGAALESVACAEAVSRTVGDRPARPGAGGFS